MMKKQAINMIWIIGKLWSYIITYKISVWIKIMRIFLYTGWISREFKSFGKGSQVYPFNCLIGGKYILIGERCTIGKNSTLTAWDRHGSVNLMPQIIIRNNVSIGDDSHITAINKIEIGNNVLTGKKITITDNSHGNSTFEMLLIPPSLRPVYSEGPVIIEDGVWIGDKVTILPNVRVGKNAIIGANAVVTKDIPANCVVGGIPAKVIKFIDK
jgi:acetyltransferase-like isoleucine patch superfamily enzyme